MCDGIRAGGRDDSRRERRSFCCSCIGIFIGYIDVSEKSGAVTPVFPIVKIGPKLSIIFLVKGTPGIFLGRVPPACRNRCWRSIRIDRLNDLHMIGITGNGANLCLVIVRAVCVAAAIGRFAFVIIKPILCCFQRQIRFRAKEFICTPISIPCAPGP